MSEIVDYPTLVAAVQAVAEDDSAEFLAYIPTAIGLTEQKLTKSIDSLGLEFTTTVVCTANSTTAARPSDVHVPKVLSYVDTSSGETILLQQRTKSYIKDYWPISTSVGSPKYYANEGYDNFLIAPTPSVTTSIEVTYQGKPAALTSAAPTNIFTTICPEALFHGTMAEQSKFMKNYSVVPMWEAAMLEDMKSLVNESRRARRDESDTPTHPSSNNLMDGEV